MKEGTKKAGVKLRDERGFTLLEYCAGAAVIVVVLYTGMNTMGEGIRDFMNGIGTWAKARGAQVSSTNATNPSAPTTPVTP